MLKLVWETTNPNETKLIARRLGERIKTRTVITLQGDLGSGKTTFTQGLAQGLDVVKTVNSPTFTISKFYQGRMDMIHIDAYRLEGQSSDLGFEEYFDQEMVSVIEWPSFIQNILPQQRIDIQINILDDTSRRLTCLYDDVYHSLMEDLV